MKQLEFTTLKIFLAVADAGSLSGAAEQCNIAIAAVSKRISDLEGSTGNQFFHRHARGMTLTPAGQALLQHAREIIFSVDRMQSDLSQYAKGVKGHVRVAATSSAISEFLPTELKRFGDDHANIAVEITEWTSQQVIESVLGGRVDLGLFVGPCSSPGLVTFPYHNDSLCLVVSKGHPLSRHGKVRFADTLAYDYIGTAPLSSISQVMMAEGGVDLKIRMRVGSSDAACRMVEAGLGIAIAPRLIVQTHVKSMNIELVDLDEPWAQRHLLVGVRSEEGLSGAAKIFLAHCLSSATASR